MKLLFKNKKEDLLSRLKNQDPVAQKIFYDQSVKKFLSVAKSYVSDLYQAEDCVIKAFCKIFILFTDSKKFTCEGASIGEE